MKKMLLLLSWLGAMLVFVFGVAIHATRGSIGVPLELAPPLLRGNWFITMAALITATVLGLVYTLGRISRYRRSAPPPYAHGTVPTWHMTAGVWVTFCCVFLPLLLLGWGSYLLYTPRHYTEVSADGTRYYYSYVENLGITDQGPKCQRYEIAFPGAVKERTREVLNRLDCPLDALPQKMWNSEAGTRAPMPSSPHEAEELGIFQADGYFYAFDAVDNTLYRLKNRGTEWVPHYSFSDLGDATVTAFEGEDQFFALGLSKDDRIAQTQYSFDGGKTWETLPEELYADFPPEIYSLVSVGYADSGKEWKLIFGDAKAVEGKSWSSERTTVFLETTDRGKSWDVAVFEKRG